MLQATKLPNEKKALEDKSKQLNDGWEKIQILYTEREKELRNALDESSHFQEQTREMHHWLTEARAFLKTKKPVGGKPETARTQLEKHQVVKELSSKALFITVATQSPIYIYNNLRIGMDRN